eukprot:SAG11_NODE_4206_length_2014_cov_1.335770_2_plen_183_part_01
MLNVQYAQCTLGMLNVHWAYSWFGIFDAWFDNSCGVYVLVGLSILFAGMNSENFWRFVSLLLHAHASLLDHRDDSYVPLRHYYYEYVTEEAFLQNSFCKFLSTSHPASSKNMLQLTHVPFVQSKVNNISYHRHGDRSKNQMQTKDEMSLALRKLLSSKQGLVDPSSNSDEAELSLRALMLLSV